jgi:hypothetical protein
MIEGRTDEGGCPVIPLTAAGKASGSSPGPVAAAASGQFGETLKHRMKKVA